MTSVLSPYRPPWFLFNGHWQTIVPALTRRVPHVAYRREVLATSDDDELQLDTLRRSSDRLVIISHGLEGDSNRPYVRGMSRAFYREGYDVLAWNFRSCGGKNNRQLRFYHSGATDDLHHVLSRWLASGRYREVILVGFSLGGNLTLKYAGERGSALDPRVKAVVTFSVPIDLAACAQQMIRPSNRIYHHRFLRRLKQKIRNKHPSFPEQLDVSLLKRTRTLIDFDDHFTAPLHGFVDAADYYRRCSSKQFLNEIKVPTLVVNAQNDPFLAERCYVSNHALNEFVIFAAPTQGGHCGFMPQGHQNGENYWSEDTAVKFARQFLSN